MDADNLISIAGVVGLTALSAYISYKVYLKVKESGVEDDMAFRLLWLIGAFGGLYIASLFRDQIDKYWINDFIFQGLSGAIILVGLHAIYVLFTTVKTKLKELGSTKIWKKLLYSAVISTVAAWGSTFLGAAEAITLAKVVIGGAVIFSVQLLG